MAKPTTSEQRDEQLIGSLLSITEDEFEVWKYFEERADRLGEQLWLTGTWLMSLLAATLSVPFVAGFIEFPDAPFPIRVTTRIPVVVIATFGIALCLYSYFALRDLRQHIEGNWRRASHALQSSLVEPKSKWDEWEAVSWRGRKQHGWYLLLGVGIFAFMAFFLLIVFACLPSA